jgi:ribosomal protein S21
MITIIVKKDEPLDKALKKFESKVRRAQVYKILKQKSYYISKSEERHRKSSRHTRSKFKA